MHFLVFVLSRPPQTHTRALSVLRRTGRLAAAWADGRLMTVRGPSDSRPTAIRRPSNGRSSVRPTVRRINGHPLAVRPFVRPVSRPSGRLTCFGKHDLGCWKSKQRIFVVLRTQNLCCLENAGFVLFVKHTVFVVEERRIFTV